MSKSRSSESDINKQILILVILFFLIDVVCMSIVYFWQHSLVLSSFNKANKIEANMSSREKEIKYLTNISKIPSYSELGHSDCNNNDPTNYVISRFNIQPISGYQIFDQICLNEGPNHSICCRTVQKITGSSIVRFTV